MAYLVQNCGNAELNYLVSQEDYPDLPEIFRDGVTDLCYQIVGITDDRADYDTLEPTGISCFFSCEDCLKKVYALFECETENVIYVVDPIFATADEKVVRLPYFKNKCFMVKEVPFERDWNVYTTLEVSGIYNTCQDCYPKKTSDPLDLNNCSPERVGKISCNYATAVYEQMITRRLEIQASTKKELDSTTMKFELLLGDLNYEQDPDLPEPTVEECCIQTKDLVCTPTPICLPCQIPTTPPEGECICTTNAGPNHTCSTYTINVLQGSLDLASGNTNTTLNNKVFFGYYPCEEYAVKTKIFTIPEEVEFCVLGIPLLGYYRADVWTPISITAGEICKEKQTCNDIP